MANLLVFLHGSGDSGPGVRSWADPTGAFERRLRSLGVVCSWPSAPARPYSLMGGAQSAVWFDRTALLPSGPEDHDGVATSCEQVSALIAEHRAAQAPHMCKVAVVGFSQGGCLALHVGSGARAAKDGIDAVVCISSFLPNDSTVRSAPGGPPLFMLHGSDDRMVPAPWGKETAEALRSSGRSVQWELYRAEHELTPAIVDATLAFVVRELGLQR